MIVGPSNADHFALIKALVSVSDGFQGFCFRPDPMCCTCLKFTAVAIDDDTRTAFYELLFEEEKGEPSAKKIRAASPPVRFDHISQILDYLGADETITTKFKGWCAAFFIDPDKHVHAVAFLSAFMLDSRMEQVDCANVSLERCINSDPLCSEILSLEQFALNKRQECVAFINPLALATSRPATKQMRTFLVERGLSVEIQALLDPDTMVVVGDTAAALWNPNIQLLPSSMITLAIMRSERQERTLEKVCDILTKEGRCLYHKDENVLQAVGRYHQGSLEITVCEQTSWREVIGDSVVYASQVCFDGHSLHATMRGSRDVEALLVRGGLARVCNNKLMRLVAMGYSLHPVFPALPKLEPQAVPVLNPDLPVTLQNAQLAMFNLTPLDKFLKEEYEKPKLPVCIVIKTWIRDDSVLYVRPVLEPDGFLEIHVSHHANSWYASGQKIRVPKQIETWTAVAFQGSFIGNNQWKATDVFLE